jgi:hypothetical protein
MYRGPSQCFATAFPKISIAPLCCFYIQGGYCMQMLLVGPFRRTTRPRVTKFCTEVDLEILRVWKYYADSPSPIGEPRQLPKGRKTPFFWKSKVQTLLISEPIWKWKIAALGPSEGHQRLCPESFERFHRPVDLISWIKWTYPNGPIVRDREKPKFPAPAPDKRIPVRPGEHRSPVGPP